MTKALRTLFQTTAFVAFAAGIVGVSGCTPTAGPDIAVATYGITSPSAQNLLATSNGTAPDQAAGVFVGASSAPQSQLTAIAETPSFAPGATPPAAVLQELASATAFNSGVGAVANSTDYVTDGVVKSVDQATPTPLTPADLAGQVPAPTLEPEAPATQVASLETSSSSTTIATPAIPDPVVTQKSARPVAAAKPSLFSNFFGNKPKKNQQILTASPQEDGARVELASLETPNNDASNNGGSFESLPGVNAKNLFALDPSLKDGDEPYDDQPDVQVASASAAGLARLAPNGILKQTDRVEVACFKPQLIAVLNSIERHYGKKIIVTSGYRSSSGNRRAGGSRNSLHISCAAADVQISGVGKWELAKYLRSMPGRGGVGTYCHTDSVHIDIGSERDWNWRCRRR